MPIGMILFCNKYEVLSTLVQYLFTLALPKASLRPPTRENAQVNNKFFCLEGHTTSTTCSFSLVALIKVVHSHGSVQCSLVSGNWLG